MSIPLPPHLPSQLTGNLRLGGFRKFLLRGNVVDLAVGIVVGAAFNGVVRALVKDFITPVVNMALPHQVQFKDRYWGLFGSRFQWGDFVNQALTFVIIAAAVYYLVVLPVNALMERFRSEPDIESPKKDCPECLSSIPEAARRCAFCTCQVA